MKLLVIALAIVVIMVISDRITSASSICETAQFSAVISGRSEIVETTVCRNNRYKWVVTTQ